MNPQRLEAHKTRVRMDDGRTLTYYDFAPQGEVPPYLAQHQQAAQELPPVGPRVLPRPPEMRWNPTLGEWSVFAPGRMARPNLPSPDACPLCPGILELPLPYQVAVFENRAPALAHIAGDVALPEPAGNIFDLTVPARGRCDLVVYSQQHNSKLARMELRDILCLVEAWRDRYGELIQLPEVRFVSIFENKGREAGMTLDHPHGQIYSFPFLPPLVQKQWDASQELGDALWQGILDREARDNSRIIAETDGFLAAQPFYSRYPYEIHVWAKRAGVASLLDMTEQERRELAGIIQHVVTRYELLHASWPNAKFDFPTLMLMQQMAKLSGHEKFRFHVEFLPLQRAPDKLKYRASVESGTGSFLNDALPETQAGEMRALGSTDVELPSEIF